MFMIRGLRTAAPPDPGAASFTVTWGAPERDADNSAVGTITGYKIYYGTTQGGPYTHSKTDTTLTTTTDWLGTTRYTSTVTALSPDQYFVVISTIDNAGSESEPGPEIEVAAEE